MRSGLAGAILAFGVASGPADAEPPVFQALGSSNTFGTGDDFPLDDWEFSNDTPLGSHAGWFPILGRLAGAADVGFTRYAFPQTTTLDFHPTFWPLGPFGFPFFEEAMDPARRGGATVALFVGLHLNDTLLGIPASATGVQFGSILDELSARGFERAYVAVEPSLFHSSLTRCEERNPALWEANRSALIAQIAAREHVLPGPDLFTHFDHPDRSTWWFAGHEADVDCYIHPNGFGYMEIAVLWCDLLRSAGELPGEPPCNRRPETPRLSGCEATDAAVRCEASPAADPDAFQNPLQLAWAVEAPGFCGAAVDVDRDGSGSTFDDRLAVGGTFTIDELTPNTTYTVCLVTYDGVQGSFFATHEVTTLPEANARLAAIVVLGALALFRRGSPPARRRVSHPRRAW